MKYMNEKMDIYELNLTPKYGVCNDVRLENHSVRKIIWLVPHIIKHDTHQNIITWRCNWGHLCKSACIYAMAKAQNKRITATHEILRKIDLTLTCPTENDTRYNILKEENIRSEKGTN
jgi:hypothetical protein